MNTQEEIDAALGVFQFDTREPFESCEEVRAFFQANNIAKTFGGTSYTQEQLDKLADYVINNHDELAFCRFRS